MNRTAPNSTVISQSGGSWYPGSGTILTYAWVEIPGFSRFGSWTAAQNAFVWCGFRPRLILCKSTSGSTDWQIIDVAHSTYNPIKDRIAPNTSTAEGVGDYTNGFDILSNGFIVRESTGGSANSGTMVFAEMPSKISRAR